MARRCPAPSRRWARFSAAAAALLAASMMISAGPAAGASGARIYVSNEFGGSLTVIDAAGERVAGTIPIGPAGTARPRGMALSPDGSTLYIAVTDPWPNRRESPYKCIWVVDAGTGKVRAKYPCGSDPEGLAVTPDGRALYCSSADIVTATVFDLGHGKVIGEMPVGVEPEGVGVSPDGRWVDVSAEA